MSKRVAKIEVVWSKELNTLHAVVRVGGEVVHSTNPVDGDRMFTEVRWPAADWARSNGYRVG